MPGGGQSAPVGKVGGNVSKRRQPAVVVPDTGKNLEKAQRRLRLAVENLENRLLHQDRAQIKTSALEQEMQVLLEDRSNLADRLDLAMTQVTRLESVGAEVSHRLEAVMGSIRAVLTKS
ncbi:MAG: DUF4164 domain-containing protein [Hyphomicrobiales bacterium]